MIPLLLHHDELAPLEDPFPSRPIDFLLFLSILFVLYLINYITSKKVSIVIILSSPFGQRSRQTNIKI